MVESILQCMAHQLMCSGTSALQRVTGMTTAALNDHYNLDNFIDTFALGHYARVLEALDLHTRQSLAFKVMRREHLNGAELRWEYRAFPHEAELLMRLADSPSVVRMVDCGYIESDEEIPSSGGLVSYHKNVKAFALDAPKYGAMGWRPYLALENLPRAHNLLYLMKPSRPDVRWRLPTEEGIALAMQFAALLQLAHKNGIVYLDHKLEHVYWDGQRLRVIDFNSSRTLDGGVIDDSQIRTDIHNLCVGILYPIFTGLSPLKTALRAQPSSIQEVDARYKSIQALDFGIEPTLSPALCDLLQRGAGGEIASMDAFLVDLREVAQLHGWDFPDSATAPDCRIARDHLRQGLRKLREGQDAIRTARDLFRDAAILDGITQDLENELRRLAKATNEMLNQRVIP